MANWIKHDHQKDIYGYLATLWRYHILNKPYFSAANLMLRVRLSMCVTPLVLRYWRPLLWNKIIWDYIAIIQGYRVISQTPSLRVKFAISPSSPQRGRSMSLITRFMGPTWGPSGADRTQVGPMLGPWSMLSGVLIIVSLIPHLDIVISGGVCLYV